jgi:DNA invertase Pin-like site-specific DNA recombinase
MRKYVTYFRVSTDEQGRSGLGLEAQVRDIDVYLSTYSDVPWEIVHAFTEIASGGDNERPVLKQAIALAKKHKATLLVSKLDRLSRRMSLVAQLMDDAKLQLRVATCPGADKPMLYVHALVSEMERDFISARTKAALQSAKARGVKLGGDRHGAIAAANAKRAEVADETAARFIGIIAPMRDAGQSLQTIADHLNLVDGGGWSAMKVKRTLERAGA